MSPKSGLKLSIKSYFLCITFYHSNGAVSGYYEDIDEELEGRDRKCSRPAFFTLVRKVNLRSSDVKIGNGLYVHHVYIYLKNMRIPKSLH